jgi:hypothetical protein
MAHLVTQQDIIDKVRFAADQQGSTLRVLDADLVTLINDALARYVGIGSAAGWSYFLGRVRATMQTGRAVDIIGLSATDYPFGILSVEFDSAFLVEGIYRVEIRIPDTGEWVDLEPIDFHQANWSQDGLSPTRSARPRVYWMHGGYSDSGSGDPIQYVGFAPPADYAYETRVWYAEIPQPASVATEMNIGPVGGEWWVVWDVVHKLAVRDHNPDQAMAAAQERERAWLELKQRTGQRNKHQAFRRVDTRGRRAALAARRWVP